MNKLTLRVIFVIIFVIIATILVGYRTINMDTSNVDLSRSADHSLGYGFMFVIFSIIIFIQIIRSYRKDD